MQKPSKTPHTVLLFDGVTFKENSAFKVTKEKKPTKAQSEGLKYCSSLAKLYYNMT